VRDALGQPGLDRGVEPGAADHLADRDQAQGADQPISHPERHLRVRGDRDLDFFVCGPTRVAGDQLEGRRQQRRQLKYLNDFRHRQLRVATQRFDDFFVVIVA